jgi:hypothetical protein
MKTKFAFFVERKNIMVPILIGKLFWPLKKQHSKDLAVNVLPCIMQGELAIRGYS